MSRKSGNFIIMQASRSRSRGRPSTFLDEDSALVIRTKSDRVKEILQTVLTDFSSASEWHGYLRCCIESANEIQFGQVHLFEAKHKKLRIVRDRRTQKHRRRDHLHQELLEPSLSETHLRTPVHFSDNQINERSPKNNESPNNGEHQPQHIFNRGRKQMDNAEEKTHTISRVKPSKTSQTRQESNEMSDWEKGREAEGREQSDSRREECQVRNASNQAVCMSLSVNEAGLPKDNEMSASWFIRQIQDDEKSEKLHPNSVRQYFEGTDEGSIERERRSAEDSHIRGLMYSNRDMASTSKLPNRRNSGSKSSSQSQHSKSQSYSQDVSPHFELVCNNFCDACVVGGEQRNNTTGISCIRISCRADPETDIHSTFRWYFDTTLTVQDHDVISTSHHQTTQSFSECQSLAESLFLGFPFWVPLPFPHISGNPLFRLQLHSESLRFFLEDILTSHEMRNSKIFLQFLGIPNHGQVVSSLNSSTNLEEYKESLVQQARDYSKLHEVSEAEILRQTDATSSESSTRQLVLRCCKIANSLHSRYESMCKASELLILHGTVLMSFVQQESLLHFQRRTMLKSYIKSRLVLSEQVSHHLLSAEGRLRSLEMDSERCNSPELRALHSQGAMMLRRRAQQCLKHLEEVSGEIVVQFKAVRQAMTNQAVGDANRVAQSAQC